MGASIDFRRRLGGLSVSIVVASVAVIFSTAGSVTAQSTSPHEGSSNPLADPEVVGAPAAPRPYDGIAAIEDAYRYHEPRRQEAIQRQRSLNEDMKFRAGVGLPSGYNRVIYAYRPPREALYAYPNNWSVGITQFGPGVLPVYGAPFGAPGSLGISTGFGFGATGVFEPWPVVPGDIWGYPYVATVPQPIGVEQFQSGPNQWESHPVYAEPWLNRPSSPSQPPATLPSQSESQIPNRNRTSDFDIRDAQADDAPASTRRATPTAREF